MRRKNLLTFTLVILAIDIAIIHFLVPELIDLQLAIILWGVEVPVGIAIYLLDRPKKRSIKQENKPDSKHQGDLALIITTLASMKYFEKKGHGMSLKVRSHQIFTNSKEKRSAESKDVIWVDIFDLEFLAKFIGHLQAPDYSSVRKDWNNLLDLTTKHNSMVQKIHSRLEERIRNDMRTSLPGYSELEQQSSQLYDPTMIAAYLFGEILNFSIGNKNEFLITSTQGDSGWTMVAHNMEDDYVLAVGPKDDAESLRKVLTAIRDSFEPESFANIISVRDKIANACSLVQKDVENLIKDLKKGVPIKGTCGSCKSK